jgi:rSAM/selenodomain-associated transferase 1
MEKALIIFVRNPELGKVKTRLAADVGNENALLIYKKLLQHTFEITQQSQAHKFIFYADKIEPDDMWQQENYFKLLQDKKDLGNRMQSAFENIFKKGYNKVCIIGSDCFELSADMIDKSFAYLDTYDLIIGPANDGGYYLLAMKNEIKDVFKNIDWSTEKVLQQTIKKTREKKYTYLLLDKLNDVDTVTDVPQLWKEDLHITL